MARRRPQDASAAARAAPARRVCLAHPPRDSCPPPSAEPSEALKSMTVRGDLVAGGLDRAGTHPSPHQHDVRVRSVVEAVPTLARRVDDVTLARRGLAVVGIDMAVALEHDEGLVAMVMAVPLVARPRL